MEKNKFCYKATVYETTKILANKLEIDPSKYVVTFQSRLTNKWLDPFTDAVLEHLPKEGSRRCVALSRLSTGGRWQLQCDAHKEFAKCLKVWHVALLADVMLFLSGLFIADYSNL